MPTISIKKKDLEGLTGISFSLEEIEHHLQLVKGEFKGYDPATDELRVELSDSNRPDLWCTEGIARQIKGKLKGEWNEYSFFHHQGRGIEDKAGQIIVSEGMKDIRPYAGGFTASGVTVDDEMLVQLIQTQEKVSEIFGSKRRRISIGVYNLSNMKFPVYYKPVSPDETAFVPLGFEEKMTLKQILEEHPKGQAYRAILKGMSSYPLLTDSKGSVLSFPPIINSREVGEIKAGDTELFVEVTGLDQRLVTLVLNILAVNLHDRGAKIGNVETIYPYETEFGKSVAIPYDYSGGVRLNHEMVDKALGEYMCTDEIAKLLREYGYKIVPGADVFVATPPPYRDDIMHPIDVCEDIAISRGYNTFTPVMPSVMTVGGLTEIEMFTDLVRGHLIGSGYQEIISNILTSKEDLIEKMCLEDGPVVEVDNIMSANYSVLRHWLVPSLMRIEAESIKSFFPHKIFETGEAAVTNPSENLSSDTLMKCAVLLSHPSANFSEIHSVIEVLMYYLQIEYRLAAGEHKSFIAGRMGYVYAGDEVVGLIGEIHPEVLERWDIHIPCSTFEVDLDKLLKCYVKGRL
ncbi:MAG: phenylalanine--tRNA ligase subunit beta [Nitrospira sp.]|nr:phenylalanine--tRNA ligase subunit beta [Nitrospira sp.]